MIKFLKLLYQSQNHTNDSISKPTVPLQNLVCCTTFPLSLFELGILNFSVRVKKILFLLIRKRVFEERTDSFFFPLNNYRQNKRNFNKKLLSLIHQQQKIIKESVQNSFPCDSHTKDSRKQLKTETYKESRRLAFFVESENKVFVKEKQSLSQSRKSFCLAQ